MNEETFTVLHINIVIDIENAVDQSSNSSAMYGDIIAMTIQVINNITE